MLPYNPVKIGVLGSYMRDSNDDKSYINILYRFRAPISIFQKISYCRRAINETSKKRKLSF